MRRSFIVVLSLVLAACGGASDSTSPPVDTNPGTTANAEVFTPGNVFSPFSTTISAGQSVKFTITGVPHNVIFVPKTGAPSDINVVSNTSATRTFNTRGTFPYDCTVHPGMSGQVVVQ